MINMHNFRSFHVQQIEIVSVFLSSYWKTQGSSDTTSLKWRNKLNNHTHFLLKYEYISNWIISISNKQEKQEKNWNCLICIILKGYKYFMNKFFLLHRYQRIVFLLVMHSFYNFYNLFSPLRDRNFNDNWIRREYSESKLVVNLFNTTYPETAVIKSCVIKILCKFEEQLKFLGMVDLRPSYKCKKILIQQISSDFDIS